MRSTPTRLARLTRLAAPAALGLTLLTAAPGVARPAEAPGLDAVTQQAGVLGALAGVTKPATELVALAAKAPDGKIPEADANRLKGEVAAALDTLKSALPAGAPAAPVPAPELPAAPPVEAPVKPPVGLPVTRAQAAPAELIATAAANLKKSVDALAAPAGEAAPCTCSPKAAAAGSAQRVVTDTVNLTAATVLGAGLPAPDLAGLPKLPALPVATH
ncbi:hypothetical protein ACN20G_12765 [Streptomyces sp. BI20]|uniref:hypothetical protein n=1 Tax=Streptomyces sp. BI20 TaxID=3403460 RepID=UPI003C783CFD